MQTKQCLIFPESHNFLSTNQTKRLNRIEEDKSNKGEKDKSKKIVEDKAILEVEDQD